MPETDIGIQLLQCYPALIVNVIWFTDDKLLTNLTNLHQQILLTERMYCPDISLAENSIQLQPVSNGLEWDVSSWTNKCNILLTVN